MRKWKGIESYQDARLISAFSNLSCALGISTVKLEGGHAYTGYVYERMVVRGTHEVGLSVSRP